MKFLDSVIRRKNMTIAFSLDKCLDKSYFTAAGYGRVLHKGKNYERLVA